MTLPTRSRLPIFAFVAAFWSAPAAAQEAPPEPLAEAPAATAADAPARAPAEAPAQAPKDPASAKAELDAEARRAVDAEARVTASAGPGAPADAGGDSSDENAEETGEQLAHLNTLGLFQRAGDVQRELASLEKKLQLPEEIDRLQKELPKLLARVESDADAAVEELETANRWHAVTNIRFRFREEDVRLKQNRAPIEAASKQVAQVPKRVDAILQEWGHAVDVLDHIGAADESRERVKDVLREARVLRYKARRAEAELARVSDILDQIQGHIEHVMSATETDAPSILTDYGHRRGTTLQLLSQLPKANVAWDRLRHTLKRNVRSWHAFTRVARGPLSTHVLLTIALLVLMLRASWREKRESSDGQPKHAVFKNPIAGAFLVSGISTVFIYVAVPAIGGVVALSLASLSASVLLMANSQRNQFIIGACNLGLLVFLVAHMFLVDLPGLEQLVLGAEGLLVGFVAWYLHRSPPLDLEGAWGTFGGVIARFWLGAAVLGLGAWAAGFDRLANILLDGTARLMLLTVAFRAAYAVSSGLVEVALASKSLAFIRAVKFHGPMLVTRTNRLLRYVFLLLWVRAFASSYTLTGYLIQAWDDTWATGFALGSLDFTVGDVLTLVLSFVLAVVAAKLVQFLLDEDVLPRTNLRYGTRAAISSGIYALMLSFGVFMAIAAAGMKLDKLAILVSALGVGIGFGLQTIVSNFVAGLILIFGRPINVRDAVQVGDLVGRVTKVGFRASTVRTFQGAEVIVPNSAFVADQVINWSLSDENRRIELDVGVAYGTDPERVIEILLRIAKENSEVVSQPETEALFVGFGDSSLNFQLRAWTDNGARWPNIKSDLAVAIDKAFREAEIEIPFPQRDLHLRSVDPEIAISK